MTTRTMRVLIAKIGLDGHDRGAKIVARELRDAGFEVIYTGLRQTLEQVVAAAIEEDVYIVGISILSGAHLELLPRLVDMLRESGAGNMKVIAGGIIPEYDIPLLKKAGVAEIFTPGTAMKEIIVAITEKNNF